MTVDVAVAGAGPAGCALARRLAQLGHRVALFERRSFDRHFAESLSPGVRVHLETLGIPMPGGRLCTSKVIEWRGETERIDEPSLIVDRGAFDAMMRSAARDAGVEIVESLDDVNEKILADATGRSGFLRRTRRYASPRTFALRARWDDVDAPDEMHVSVFEEGWMWGVRAADGSYHVATFVDAASVRKRPYFEFLTREPDEVHTTDATSFVTENPVDRESIVVGEAACAIDPLSSSGIQTALGGAIAAAITVNTMLRMPERTDAAIRFYTDHVQRVFARHSSWTAAHYATANGGGAFWQSRGGQALLPVRTSKSACPPPDALIALHPEAAVINAPVVIGDVIDMRPVVRTPTGEHVAFVGEREIAPLLTRLSGTMRAADLARSWNLGPRDAIAVMQWLVANEVVRPLSSVTHAATSLRIADEKRRL